LTVVGVDWTASELRDRAHALGGLLLESGIRAGDRVAVMSENRSEFVEMWFACAVIGAVMVPINAGSRGVQLNYVLNDCDPRAIVLADDLWAVLEDSGGPPAGVHHVWRVKAHSFELGESLPSGLPGRRCKHSIAPRDTAVLLYTSGTTGPSKGVLSPHSQIYWYAANTASALGVTADDVLYTCLPLFHMNALNTIAQGLISGARVVIGPKFSASRFWSRVIEADATVTYLLGTLVSILASAAPSDADKDHRIRIALAPATPESLWNVFSERFGIQLVEGHGMTETNLVIGPRDGEQRPGWMGRVMPGFEARVVDDLERDVPAGESGQMFLRTSVDGAFANGYWGKPVETEAAWREGWFRTGDRVIRDDDGYFKFLDRIKDVIRRRGENISAWEVEQVIEAHEAVASAAVVPVPSELGEDEVMAFIVLRPGVALDPVEITAYCEPRMAPFAVPRYVEFLDALPLTPTGRVQKYALRERGVGTATWDRAAVVTPTRQ
jgi:crotonobetaine/carnitine-CoA ligase